MAAIVFMMALAAGTNAGTAISETDLGATGGQIRLASPLADLFLAPTLDPASLTPSSFLLTPQGGSPVPAAVSYDVASRTATLTPDADLADLTLYTAELTTAVTNTSGLGLASAVTWSFTTLALGDLAQVVPVPDQGAVILWDGKTTLAFRYVPSGFDSGSFRDVRKMVLLK